MAYISSIILKFSSIQLSGVIFSKAKDHENEKEYKKVFHSNVVNLLKLSLSLLLSVESQCRMWTFKCQE